MDTKMYEIVCEPGNVHYTLKSNNMDEVLEAGRQHVKRVHSQDVTLDYVRNIVHEVDQPQSAK